MFVPVTLFSVSRYSMEGDRGSQKPAAISSRTASGFVSVVGEAAACGDAVVACAAAGRGKTRAHPSITPATATVRQFIAARFVIRGTLRENPRRGIDRYRITSDCIGRSAPDGHVDRVSVTKPLDGRFGLDDETIVLRRRAAV
jgi:hypothetical protein